MRGRYGRNRHPRLGYGIHLAAFVGLCALWLGAASIAAPALPTLTDDAPVSRTITIDRTLQASVAAPDGESFVTWFADGHDDETWYRSDFDNVDHFQQVGWKPEHLDFDGDAVNLWLTNRPSETNPYTSAEYQKRGRYGFGRYEVIMKAARGSGLVSSFFTHTGPYFGDPHDEIDFEFLGKDTRRVWLNWFTNGTEGQSKWHHLDFDAADDYHLYAFEWTPETIRWFVDGELIYERPDNALAVPVTPGRIIINLWTGRDAQHDWHGEPTFAVADHASYLCISFRGAADTEARQCSDGWYTATLASR